MLPFAEEALPLAMIWRCQMRPGSSPLCSLPLLHLARRLVTDCTADTDGANRTEPTNVLPDAVALSERDTSLRLIAVIHR
jgi:hypothetical protein